MNRLPVDVGLSGGPHGAWRAAEADEALRRAYPEPDFDDSSWAEIEVPSHWRSTSAFAESDGPLLYRRRFGWPTAPTGQRSWLVFDGVFYQSDVWLDGSYVGDTEGYFFPHAFEVTQALSSPSGRSDGEHVLAVEVACSRPGDPRAKRNITGTFQHSDFLDPGWNPGGIWRDVRVEQSGPVRIARLRALCPEASEERAVVSLRAVLDAAEAAVVRLRTTVGSVEHELEQPVAAGENRVSWNVFVEGPDLWWPWSLGPQTMTDVDVSVSIVNGTGQPETASDSRSLRTGLRHVAMKDFVFTVNGERLFLKGSVQGPTRMDLACAHAADFERDVLLARDAGLDLLRLGAHISRPELYEAADRHGMLLWQDFPLQWGYARGIRKQAARQAREAVDLLGHHPSIAVWCGHNEPMAMDPAAAPEAARSFKRVVLQQVPTWNKTVLDSSVKRAFERADGSRPVVAHSGVLPGLVSGGTDSHLFFGWHRGSWRDVAGYLAAWPRMARFVSEFGARSVPTGWTEADWREWTEGAGGDTVAGEIERHVPRSGFSSFEDWRDATQEYQAVVVRRTVETLRRLKYRPTGGFSHLMFADGAPGATWSVLGVDRSPKAGYDALAAACAPVIVVADAVPAQVAGGDALALDVHVVSDLRTPIVDGRVRAVLSWPGGSHEWSWAGDVDADSVARIGTVSFVVPDGVTLLVLDLELSAADGVKATNRFTTDQAPA
ncbi:MAG: beta-mannosidase [Acidimicrobiaceae bacterium]|nr:beta-mannosidase [Acidimicrobiaceae bacterium]